MRTIWDGIKTMSDMKQNGHNSNRLSPLGVKMTGRLQRICSLSILVVINTIFVLSLMIISSTKTGGNLHIEEKKKIYWEYSSAQICGKALDLMLFLVRFRRIVPLSCLVSSTPSFRPLLAYRKSLPCESQKDKNELQRVVNIGSKITGFKQSPLTAL